MIIVIFVFRSNDFFLNFEVEPHIRVPLENKNCLFCVPRHLPMSPELWVLGSAVAWDSVRGKAGSGDLNPQQSHASNDFLPANCCPLETKSTVAVMKAFGLSPSLCCRFCFCCLLISPKRSLILACPRSLGDHFCAPRGDWLQPRPCALCCRQALALSSRTAHKLTAGFDISKFTCIDGHPVFETVASPSLAPTKAKRHRIISWDTDQRRRPRQFDIAHCALPHRSTFLLIQNLHQLALLTVMHNTPKLSAKKILSSTMMWAPCASNSQMQLTLLCLKSLKGEREKKCSRINLRWSGSEPHMNHQLNSGHPPRWCLSVIIIQGCWWQSEQRGVVGCWQGWEAISDWEFHHSLAFLKLKLHHLARINCPFFHLLRAFLWCSVDVVRKHFLVLMKGFDFVASQPKLLWCERLTNSWDCVASKGQPQCQVNDTFNGWTTLV